MPWALYPHSPLGQISQGWGGHRLKHKGSVLCSLCLCRRKLKAREEPGHTGASETSKNFWFVDVTSGTHQEAEMLGLGRKHHPEAD